MVAAFTALFDACVLYSAPLRDLLLHLALTDLFRARWTDRIHDEWIRNLLANRPDLSAAQLQRTRRLMDENVRDCLVTGYESLVDGLHLPDSDDRYVLAAAIRSGAAVIVTYNLDDFPKDYVQTFGVEAQHPDDFISHLMDLSFGLVRTALERQRQSLRNPPMDLGDFLAVLSRQRLPVTVSRLRRHLESN